MHDPGAGGPAPPPMDPDRQTLLDQLRGANEQLIISSLQSQELADAAEASRVEADAANRLKDEFLAIVSHELRNPLNAIIGWSRLLGAGQLDPTRTTDAISVIERNARALARIIDDLLDMSRIIGGQIRIDAQPVDLVAVTQSAVDAAQPSAQEKGVRLSFGVPAVPNPAAGDAIRLHQVVANLLSNAIKFTGPGGAVEVTLVAAGSHCEIVVSDTGQGIDAGFLPEIFARFSQADPSTTRRQGGLGLGLAIAKALVERHGGTIWADSPGPGLGATFTVRLPVLASRPAELVGQPSMATRGAGSVRLDGIRLLLVEDHDDGREMLERLLAMAGAKVTAARSVREALASLDTMRPDVIVSDIGMPGEDGYTLIRLVRARGLEEGGRAPAIALTGYVGPEARARLLAAGFQAHVQKPVELEELAAIVAALVGIGKK